MPLVAALIGAGGVAHHHARAYQLDDRVSEIWVVDTRWEVHEQFAQQYPKVSHTTTDYEDAVNADVVSFVDICLPHYLHHPVALMALRAGKHVVLEKPIAMTIEEATQMLEEAERAERCLFVSMNQLAYPSHITVQQLLREGVIGKPFLAVVNVFGNELERMMDATNWKGDWKRAGGGALIDTGYHAIYVLQRFFGRPTAVTARLPRLIVPHENKADDNAVVILEFPNDMLANIVVSYTVTSQPWSETRMLFGTEGSIHIRDLDAGKVRLFKHGREVTVESESFNSNAELYTESIRRALSQFLTWVVDGIEPDIKPQEAVDALHTAIAAYESHRLSRRVIIEW